MVSDCLIVSLITVRGWIATLTILGINAPKEVCMFQENIIFRTQINLSTGC